MKYALVHSKSTNDAGKLRQKARRCGISRVVVSTQFDTIIGLASSHGGRWLDKFARESNSAVLDRSVPAPTDTLTAACGIELLDRRKAKLHAAHCHRCKAVSVPVDIRTDTQRQVSETAAAGNARNSMVEVRVGNETAVSTHDELGTRLETIETAAMSLAADAEAARQTLRKLGEMEAELATLQRSYTEAIATAGTLLAGGLNGS